jgi:hypothetical protein
MVSFEVPDGDEEQVVSIGLGQDWNFILCALSQRANPQFPFWLVASPERASRGRRPQVGMGCEHGG